MSDTETRRHAVDTAASAMRRPGEMFASPFFRLLAVNWLIGAFAAVLVLCGLLWLDTGGLRTLILNSPEPWLPVLVLLFGLMVTLCSAAMGAAVMLLPSSRDDGHGKGRRARDAGICLPGLALQPAMARAGTRRPRQD
jgi:hypothetical protein